jgi:hypothetical protein
MREVRSLTRHTTKRPAFAPRQAGMLPPRRERPRIPSTGRRHPEYFQDLRTGLHSWYFALQSIAAVSRADGQGHRASVTAMSLNFKRISLSLNTTKLSEQPP